MKCYNHEDRDAVATCQQCGKGLCKVCAARHRPCSCDECVSQAAQQAQYQAQCEEHDRAQKYRDALVDTRSEFIKMCVIGGVLASIIIEPAHSAGKLEGFACLLYFFLVFVAPFGWKLLTYLQSYMTFTIFGTIKFWFIWIGLKCLLSVIIGVPAFFYQLVKTFAAHKELTQDS